LGTVPSSNSYLAALVVTLINFTVVGIFFVRFRARIAYWV
jgi:lipopolysaccharide transport system permease protein